MAITTANVVTSTDAFNDFINKFNNVATIISNNAITANSTLSVTVGNAYVNGIFSSNTLVATQGLRGGNNSTTGTLVVTSNLQMNVATTVVGSIQVTGTSLTSIDSFPISGQGAMRSAKYILQISTSSGYQATEIMLLQDGTNVFVTEYATLTNSTSMGTFSANIFSGSINLNITPTQSTSNVYFHRTTLSL